MYERQVDQDFVSKVEIIYRNYEQIKKGLKAKEFPETKIEEITDFKR